MKIQFFDGNRSIVSFRPVSSLFVVLALLLCTAFTASAQNTSASLRGTVIDTQGGALAGALITAGWDGAGPEHAVRAAMTATTASGRREMPGMPGMRIGRTGTSLKRPWPARRADREPRSARSSLIVRFGWLRWPSSWPARGRIPGPFGINSGP